MNIPLPNLEDTIIEYTEKEESKMTLARVEDLEDYTVEPMPIYDLIIEENPILYPNLQSRTTHKRLYHIEPGGITLQVDQYMDSPKLRGEAGNIDIPESRWGPRTFYFRGDEIEIERIISQLMEKGPAVLVT